MWRDLQPRRGYMYVGQQISSKVCVLPSLVDEKGNLLSTGAEKDGILKKLFVSIFTHHQTSQVSQVPEHLGGMGYFINAQGGEKNNILYSVNCKLSQYLMQDYIIPRHSLNKYEVICYPYKFVFLAYNMQSLETRPQYRIRKRNKIKYDFLIYFCTLSPWVFWKTPFNSSQSCCFEIAATCKVEQSIEF